MGAGWTRGKGGDSGRAPAERFLRGEPPAAVVGVFQRANSRREQRGRGNWRRGQLKKSMEEEEEEEEEHNALSGNTTLGARASIRRRALYEEGVVLIRFIQGDGEVEGVEG